MKQIALVSVISTLLGSHLLPCGAINQGIDAESGRAPWFVSVVNENYVHMCGGTLVAPDLVITAASCAPSPLEWSRDVDYALIGYDSATANGTEVIGIDDVYIHPLWDSSNGHYDVMLLVLETPSSIPYATLNTDPSFPDSNVLPQIEIFGIGDATTLQFTSLIHISDQLCFAYLQAGGATGKLYRQFPPGTMCITEYNTRGQCDGDLGGPMVELGETFTEDIVVGVMASNSGSCAAGVPYPTKGVRTSAIVPFIQDIACSYSVSPPSYLACPTKSPSPSPSDEPTSSPVESDPSSAPTAVPSEKPSSEPTLKPSMEPTAEFSTTEPTAEFSTMEPSEEPTTSPVDVPSDSPSDSQRADNCLGRMAACDVSLDCCTGRCMLGSCQAVYVPIPSRTSLRGNGRGGAAGKAINVGLADRGTAQGFGFGD